MNITREDVLKVGYELKVLPLTENQIAYCMVEFDRMADQDPTGYWELWIEQLLEECEDTAHIDEYINSIILGFIICIIPAKQNKIPKKILKISTVVSIIMVSQFGCCTSTYP